MFIVRTPTPTNANGLLPARNAMRFLSSLLLVALLGPRAARAQNTTISPNAAFVDNIADLVPNASDVKNCLDIFAQAADSADFLIVPNASISISNATRDASVLLKACLDNTVNGTLKNVAMFVFSPFLDIANNLADFDSILSSECLKNTTTEVGQKALDDCIGAKCANLDRTLLSGWTDLLELMARVPRQEENRRCKVVKCVGLCRVQIQAVSCGQEFNNVFFRNFKLQVSAFLYSYLLGMIEEESICTFPCRCRWFFK